MRLLANFNATTPGPGHYISNGSEDRGGEEGDRAKDEGYVKIVE